jgi:hypothetical protein
MQYNAASRHTKESIKRVKVAPTGELCPLAPPRLTPHTPKEQRPPADLTRGAGAEAAGAAGALMPAGRGGRLILPVSPVQTLWVAHDVDLPIGGMGADREWTRVTRRAGAEAAGADRTSTNQTEQTGRSFNATPEL